MSYIIPALSLPILAMENRDAIFAVAPLEQPGVKADPREFTYSSEAVVRQAFCQRGITVFIIFGERRRMDP